ncbi:MAG: PQQ-like beta-propeller repeat protein [Planctomycetaceae bacterium]|nr:PQQ-like beta-propeller repeat protein [Planctomycetaceae bacterium]
MKNLFWTALFLITLGQCTVVWGQSAPPFSAVQTRNTPLFVELEVQRFGLTRSWFNQIALDQKRYSIKHILLQDGTLFVVSSDAQLHAIDAETGASLWTVELGEQGTICNAPAANSRMVAVLGGTNLQIFDRKTGRKVWENEVSGVPGAGCALSERHVYLPLISGRILAWPLEEEEVKKTLPPELEDAQNEVSQDKHDLVLAELSAALDEIRASLREKVPPVPEEPFRLKPPKFIPLECQSFGQTLIQPITAKETEADEYLVWPTTRGDVYLSCIGSSVKDIFTLLYRIRIAPQAFSYTPMSGISFDWGAPRTVFAQLTYSPQQVLAKEGSENVAPQEQEEDENTTPSDDPFAKKSTVRSKVAAPQDYGDEENDIFGSLGDEEEPFLQEEEEEQPFAPTDDVFTPAPTKNVAPPTSKTESNDEIIPSMILAGNVAGFVVAISDSTGEVLWKFVATDPVVQRVIIVKNHVYACTLNGGMYCLDAKSGKEIWFTRGITQFIAESKDCVYALNFRREIAILDRETGCVQATIPAMPLDFFLDNDETDRIYAGTKNGLLQGLHEINVVEPIKHRPNRMDLAEQLRVQVEEAIEQKMQRRPMGTIQPRSASVPDFGSGFGSFDEESPFGGTDDSSNFQDSEEDDSSPFF